MRMVWIAGDAAQAEDMARRSPWVIEQRAGRLEEQRLHLRGAVADGTAVEERAVQSEAVQELRAVAMGKMLDARPWDDNPKHQARRSAVVSAAHAEDSPADQSLEGTSW